MTSFLIAGGASAGTVINYTTNLLGTQFVGDINSLVLNSTAGEAATLTFVPNTSSISGVPSNINLGDFLLVCRTCTTTASTIFSAFTFDLVINDITDGATGKFVGTSTGGSVSSNSSTIQIAWTLPVGLQLGPGSNNALSGDFGTTAFNLIVGNTLIVAPNSGTDAGDTTIQGQVSSATPEPVTFAMVAGGLLASAVFIRTKRLNS